MQYKIPLEIVAGHRVLKIDRAAYHLPHFKWIRPDRHIATDHNIGAKLEDATVRLLNVEANGVGEAHILRRAALLCTVGHNLIDRLANVRITMPVFLPVVAATDKCLGIGGSGTAWRLILNGCRPR